LPASVHPTGSHRHDFAFHRQEKTFEALKLTPLKKHNPTSLLYPFAFKLPQEIKYSLRLSAFLNGSPDPSLFFPVVTQMPTQPFWLKQDEELGHVHA